MAAYVNPTPHEGPSGVTYHHVGTGVTDSNYWCPTCPGWFGVPHDDYPHDRYDKNCACVPCQKKDRRYPREGVLMTHAEYRQWRRACRQYGCDADHHPDGLFCPKHQRQADSPKNTVVDVLNGTQSLILPRQRRGPA